MAFWVEFVTPKFQERLVVVVRVSASEVKSGIDVVINATCVFLIVHSSMQ